MTPENLAKILKIYSDVDSSGNSVFRVNIDATGITIGDVDIGSTGGTETPTASVATDSTGSPITAGKTAITFTTSGTFVGTILGVARNPNTTYILKPTNPSKLLAAVAYTVTGGSMTIDVQS